MRWQRICPRVRATEQLAFSRSAQYDFFVDLRFGNVARRRLSIGDQRPAIDGVVRVGIVHCLGQEHHESGKCS